MKIEDLTPQELEILKRLAREETDEEKRKRLEKQAEEEKRAAEDAKKSPYRNFLQVNQDNYKAEAWLMRQSLGISPASITRAIKLLQEHNYMKVGKSGTTNIYMVNKELYWHSYGTNYARAEFGAKIIISADEQEPAEREEIKLKAKRYKAIEVEGEPQPQQTEPTTEEKATA